ncbi:zinc finger protein 33A-like [Plodia interpunctella]|uniref:zinc finger protein 33A-like n=1 Tax=Plodia interpunctella TaxID=58824 RepID=UPI002367484D|nr:zinc finger protein 33A-like [Plodia interpunctella]
MDNVTKEEAQSAEESNLSSMSPASNMEVVLLDKCDDVERTIVITDATDDSPSVNQRIMRAKIKKGFKCTECPQTFTSQSRYDEHMSTHDDGELYQCRTCSKAFQSKTGLLNHIRIHIASKKRTYKCAVCENTFETNQDLKKHKLVHAGNIFSCNLAKKCSELTFNDHCEYWYHELSHFNSSKQKCFECGMYINKHYMKTHILTHFDRREKCGICGGSYENLEKHIKTHGQEVDCVECGKSFKDKGGLKRHMYTHTGVKKYQCLYCGKGFITTQKRRTHTLMHTGEKPYECDICGHRSKQLIDSQRHRQTHSKEKKYQCDYCKKMFYHKSSVLAHIRAHTKSRFYHCNQCDFTTATRTGLRSHITYKHIDVKPFYCALCDVGFKVKSQLGRHHLTKSHRNNAYGAMKLKTESEN